MNNQNNRIRYLISTVTSFINSDFKQRKKERKDDHRVVYYPSEAKQNKRYNFITNELTMKYNTTIAVPLLFLGVAFTSFIPIVSADDNDPFDISVASGQELCDKFLDEQIEQGVDMSAYLALHYIETYQVCCWSTSVDVCDAAWETYNCDPLGDLWVQMVYPGVCSVA